MIICGRNYSYYSYFFKKVEKKQGEFLVNSLKVSTFAPDFLKNS